MNASILNTERIALGVVAMVGAASVASGGEIVLPPTPTDTHYRVVAATDQPAPGGGAFTILEAPAMSNNGRVAFVAAVDGVFVQTGLWSEGHSGTGALESIAREYQSFPSALSLSYGEFNGGMHTPVMSEAGDIAFGAPIVGDALAGFGESAIMRYQDGQLDVVAMPHDPAPGGGYYDYVSNLPSMNNLGEVVYFGGLYGAGIGDGNDSGVWRGAPGALSELYREGDVIAPYFNRTMGDAYFNVTTINDDGVVAARNFYNHAGQSRWGTWRLDGTGVSWNDRIAVSQTPSPAGPNYTGSSAGWGTVAINNNNDALFSQTFQGAGLSNGVWFDQNGADSGVAFSGSFGPFGVQFDSVEPYGAKLNGQGDTVFTAYVTANWFLGVRAGVFARLDGALEALAIEGGNAAGFGAGVKYTGDGGDFRHAINNHGRIAFKMQVEGPGINASNNDAIWVTNANGAHDLLIREGQNIFVNGAVRTVDDFMFRTGYGPESGRRSAFNDLGQVGMLVDFTDGSQAVIVATVPPECPGDGNGDGAIDTDDLNAVLMSMGSVGDAGMPGDMDLDGDVDTDDLNIVLAGFGDPCSN